MNFVAERENETGRGNYLPVILLFLTAALAGIGLLMIYSAGSVYSLNTHGDRYFIIRRQLYWLGAGLAAGVIAARTDYHWWQGKSRFLLLFGVVLLAAVFVPGLSRRGGGARRWLGIGGLNFQPAELVKYLAVIYLADLLSRRRQVIERFGPGLLPPLAATGLIAGLVVIQPDLGTALSIAVIGLMMIYLAGGRLLHLGLLSLSSLPILAAMVIRVGYRMRRILAFIDPWSDPRGSGFQIIQSLIALGSGGPTGLGLGESRQKLFYLPASTTDFIFSILGEELGFVGTGLTVVLTVGILTVGFMIAARAGDLFGRLLAQGVTAMLVIQALINMGVSCGLLPTKGLPFPFISYGGSNLLASCLAVGILVSIAAHREEACRRRRGPRPICLFKPKPPEE